mmetsp:Transcript_6745/g.20905  ORF Transcript_6745/g.20905 Transcript_6745/m.20905 type:complete len:409 (-) Transcript_6745:22-1248(-)
MMIERPTGPDRRVTMIGRVTRAPRRLRTLRNVEPELAGSRGALLSREARLALKSVWLGLSKGLRAGGAARTRRAPRALQSRSVRPAQRSKRSVPLRRFRTRREPTLRSRSAPCRSERARREPARRSPSAPRAHAFAPRRAASPCVRAKTSGSDARSHRRARPRVPRRLQGARRRDGVSRLGAPLQREPRALARVAQDHNAPVARRGPSRATPARADARRRRGRAEDDAHDGRALRDALALPVQGGRGAAMARHGSVLVPGRGGDGALPRGRHDEPRGLRPPRGRQRFLALGQLAAADAGVGPALRFDPGHGRGARRADVPGLATPRPSRVRDGVLLGVVRGLRPAAARSRPARGRRVAAYWRRGAGRRSGRVQLLPRAAWRGSGRGDDVVNLTFRVALCVFRLIFTYY